MEPNQETNDVGESEDLNDYERAIAFRWNDPRYLAHFIALGGVVAPSFITFTIDGVSYVSLAGGAVAILAAVVAVVGSLRLKHGRAWAALFAASLLLGGIARVLLSGFFRA